MSEKDEQFMMELVAWLTCKGVRIDMYDQYDGAERYAGSRVVFVRESDGAEVAVEDVVS